MFKNCLNVNNYYKHSKIDKIININIKLNYFLFVITTKILYFVNYYKLLNKLLINYINKLYVIKINQQIF